MDRRRAITLMMLAAAAAACSRGPRALLAGTDTCAHCRMTIDDLRFGALLLTARGKLETFDSIECLAAYVAALPDDQAPRGTWVADFDQPAHWVEASRATYLQDSQLRSPMGRSLAAFADGADHSALTGRYGGRVIDWPAVLSLVAQPAGASSAADSTPHTAHAH